MDIVLVGLGGGLGAIARVIFSKISTTRINEIIMQLSNGSAFYTSLLLPTFAINLIACFLIGLLLQVLTDSKNLSALLITGFLGGFSTFSAFGIETYKMISENLYLSAVTYVLASVVFGIVFVAIGYKLSYILDWAK
jgi:CrcB protein